MKTQEILSIVALGLLGVCLLCGLAKMTMKGDKAKKSCDHVCSLSFFVAVVLLGVSQLIKENKDGYTASSSIGDDGEFMYQCTQVSHPGKAETYECLRPNWYGKTRFEHPLTECPNGCTPDKDMETLPQCESTCGK